MLITDLKFTSTRVYYGRLRRLLEQGQAGGLDDPITIMTLEAGNVVVVDGVHRCWLKNQLGQTTVDVVELDEDNWEQKLPNTLQQMRYVTKKKKTKKEQHGTIKQYYRLMKDTYSIDDIVVIYPNWSSNGPIDSTAMESKLAELIANFGS